METKALKTKKVVISNHQIYYVNDSLFDLVSSDPFLSSREMAKTLYTSHTTTLSHLRELGKTLQYGRWLPHELRENNKLSRFTVASSLLFGTK